MSYTKKNTVKVIDYEALIRERETKIKTIRDSHTPLKPSIYIQNSHSHHLWECKELKKNFLLIMIGSIGVSSIGNHELLLQEELVIQLLKSPIRNKDELNHRLIQLREYFPMLTFHYSDYFGIKPEGDKKRTKCTKFSTTASYYDIEYESPATYPDDDCKARRIGLTTLDQFQEKYKICTPRTREPLESINIKFFDSLDISNFHILSKINFLSRDMGIYDIKVIKEIMPYLDVSKFNDIRELRASYDEKDETMKLSELMEINGPGIYIHYACRPFVHKEGFPNNNFNSDNESAYENLRANSKNTLVAARCPIHQEIIARGYLNKISGLYRGCDSIKKVLIAKEVTKIEYSSFDMCSNLEIVEFEENSNLTFIGEKAFRKCVSLKRINIPDSVTKIEKYTFLNCENLTDIFLPDSVTELEGYTFCKCTNLQTIRLSNNIEVIKINTFEDCNKLTTINIPFKLHTIEEKAFLNCKSLKIINFPNKTIDFIIQHHAFHGCISIEEVNINSNATINSSPADQTTINFFITKVKGIKRKKLKNKKLKPKSKNKRLKPKSKNKRLKPKSKNKKLKPKSKNKRLKPNIN
jgi:hypothetical protein